MTEASLAEENALLRDEIRILKARLEACHLIKDRDLKELVRDGWRPYEETLDLEEGKK